VSATGTDAFSASVVEALLPSNGLNVAGKQRTYMESRPPAVDLDTVVIHHISAINWDRKDSGIPQEIKEKYRELAEGLSPDERAFSPELCRAILEAFGFSAHYLIDRDGRIFSLVPENMVAYHAGKSKMPEGDGRESVNGFSIGIELVALHPDNYERLEQREGGEGYTDAQYRSLQHLLGGIITRHPVTQIVGHDEIAGEKAMRLGLRTTPKSDPGPDFEWEQIRDSERSPLEALEIEDVGAGSLE